MIRLKMKNYNMILTEKLEKLQKYQPYHQVKLISMNILQVKRYYLLANYCNLQTEPLPGNLWISPCTEMKH